MFLPMALPAVAVTSISVFIDSWNELVLWLKLMRSPERFTLPSRVFSLVGGALRVDREYVMAATFLASVPVAIVFSRLQRYLVRGLPVGAVKEFPGISPSIDRCAKGSNWSRTTTEEQR